MTKDSDPNIAGFSSSAKLLADKELASESLENESLSSQELASETARLLSELDRAIEHSSTLRNIIRQQEALLELERITGCSRKSKTLREEITHLEQQLYSGPDNTADSDPSLSAA